MADVRGKQAPPSDSAGKPADGALAAPAAGRGGTMPAAGDATAFANPLFRGADPHAAVFGSKVWIYPTSAGGYRHDRFYAYCSSDLKHWPRHGPVLEFDDVRWIKDDGQPVHYAWAPAVVARDGRFFFYFSVGPQGETPARIGVAVGDNPAGPFKDCGRPLLTGGDGFEAIDPMVFADPRSGRYYLYAGGSAGATLRVFELNDDLISLAREIKVATPRRFTEGAFMHYYGGRYHLTYSHGRWSDSSYSIHYATADSPTGPWDYRGALLESDDHRKGPGHHSIIQSPLNGEWLMVYHRWEGVQGDGPYRGSRQVCIDRLEYDKEGFLKPVRMTGRKEDQSSVIPFSRPSTFPRSGFPSSVFARSAIALHVPTVPRPVSKGPNIAN
ncbi:MAG TPA: family 43 glycosylhydrolase [Verrucomicrobiota bacterium]|nr:family 43 glycosylhydrolase [Verrucomicrobiota bacterium]